jgi:hypothetical protein
VGTALPAEYHNFHLAYNNATVAGMGAKIIDRINRTDVLHMPPSDDSPAAPQLTPDEKQILNIWANDGFLESAPPPPPMNLQIK